MDREIKLRTVLFFVIGFLLVLSLIICIYIVAGESKLVPVEATVVNVTKDAGGAGVDNVEISYTVDGAVYGTYFDSKKDLKSGDTINVYYYSNDYTKVKYSKTSKLIFLCPVVGLVLCALGIFELYRRRNDGEDEFKTSAIGVVGNTEQLKIVTENTEVKEPEQPVEEKAEVKTISKPVEEEIPQQIEEIPVYEEVDAPMTTTPDPVVEEVATTPETTPASTTPVVEAGVVEPQPVTDITNVEEVKEKPKEEEKKENNLEDVLVEKVKEKGADKMVSEEDLKEAIKDVLVDVIKEVKKEKKTKEIVQVRVIPNYYFISGTSLMYEEAGKAQKELNLKDIKNVTRTINEAGNVVKLVVESPEVKCILTNMKNIDLEQLSNLLRNKMRAMDDSFEEVIEHKEY